MAKKYHSLPELDAMYYVQTKPLNMNTDEYGMIHGEFSTYSEIQMNNGWDTDYLGMYKFYENYISAQGYRVNLLEDTTGENEVENYVSEKCAIFVADGVRYTLRGRTSIETMKAIVDSMK